MAFEFTEYKVGIKFNEPLLGSVPKNKEVFTKHVQKLAVEKELITDSQADEEIESVQDLADFQGETGFFSDKDGKFLMDYQIKGFLKSAAETMKQFGNVKQLRSKVVKYVFVRPRRLYLPNSDQQLQRPLRAKTARGERSALASSDMIPAGFGLEFKIRVLEGGGITEHCLRDLLDYGQYSGLGQWRGASYGQFEVVKFEEV